MNHDSVEDTIKKHNFDEATPEDKFDKTLLPSVLQVRNFGKRSRTKYTHLVSEVSIFLLFVYRL